MCRAKLPLRNCVSGRQLSRRWLTAILLLLPGLWSPGGSAQGVISLDYCADQYVLKFVPRARILALSPDATKAESYLRVAAAGLPQVRPRAEDVLLLQPDLLVRAYGGGPRIGEFARQAGIELVQLGWVNDLAGVAAQVQRVAERLGNAAAGRAELARMQQRLAALPASLSAAPQALYLTPSGYTTGPGSLQDAILRAAGLRNWIQRPGWRPLPLERLAYEQPDLLVLAFSDADFRYQDAWSPMRHPVLADTLDKVPVIELDAATVSCGAWFALDAAETLATAR